MLKDVLADTTVNAFMAHVDTVKSHYGLDAFLNYVDSSVPAVIQGRLYYKVEIKDKETHTPLKMAFNDSDFPLALKEKYEELTKNGKDFDNYFSAVLERFKENDGFKALIQEFETKNPGKGEALGRFIAAQAAYVILENIERLKLDEKENVAVGQYKSAERNIKANTKKISVLESDPKLKRSPELKMLRGIQKDIEQRMPTLTTEYSNQGKIINRTLDRARKSIEPFVSEKVPKPTGKPSM